MSGGNFINFPTEHSVVEEAVGDLNEAMAAKKVRAVAIITLEDTDHGATIRVRHGWGEESVTAMELLALAAGLEHSSRKVHDVLES